MAHRFLRVAGPSFELPQYTKRTKVAGIVFQHTEEGFPCQRIVSFFRVNGAQQEQRVRMPRPPLQGSTDAPSCLLELSNGLRDGRASVKQRYVVRSGLDRLAADADRGFRVTGPPVGLSRHEKQLRVPPILVRHRREERNPIALR